MAQPVDQNSLKEVLLTVDEVKALAPPSIVVADTSMIEADALT